MLLTHCFVHLADSYMHVWNCFWLEIIATKTTNWGYFHLPNFHFHLPNGKIYLPQAIGPEFFPVCTWNMQIFLLTFGGAGVLFCPYRFRQYSTHVWYGFEVFGQPLTGPSILGGSSGFSLSNVNKWNENMSISHDSYGGRSTKNLLQWIIPFLLAPLPLLLRYLEIWGGGGLWRLSQRE